MAVMDFREGGYVFSRHKVRREFSYDQDNWDGAGDAVSGDSRFAADPDGSEGISVRLTRLTHYLGAVASVGLMVGLMVWGWQLVSRDVSGVPVIKAIAGDARTTPEDPGGKLTSYTGYSVNGVTEGAEPARTDTVAIAPAAVGLTDEDVAMGTLGAEARDPANTPDAPLSFDGEEITPMSDSEARALAEEQAAAEANRLAVASDSVEDSSVIDAPVIEGSVNEALTDENGVPAQTDAINAALAQAQAAANLGAIVASPRPAPRPRITRLASAGTMATDAAPAAPARRPAEPTAKPAVDTGSGPLVQLGAFDSNAIANGEWNRLSGKFGSLFSDKGQVIQKYDSNGRTFWRLRVAGFSSIRDARQFCSAVKSGGTDCIALSR